MSPRILLLAAFATTIGLLAGCHRLSRRPAAEGPVAHVENRFRFTVNAPPSEVLPLFGGWGEKAWAGDDWDPCFLHPLPPRDVAGAVFTVSKPHGTSIWVNTTFDLEGGSSSTSTSSQVSRPFSSPSAPRARPQGKPPSRWRTSGQPWIPGTTPRWCASAGKTRKAARPGPPP